MPTKQPMPPVPPLQPLLFWETGVLLFVAGNRHGTFSGSGSDGLRLVRMDGQPDAPPSLLPAGGCVRHRRLVVRRKVRSPRPPRVPGMAGKEPVLTAGRHRGRRDRRFPRLAGSASANHSGRCGPRRKGTAPRQAGPDVAGHAGAPRPLPGQRITANLKIRPVHGFRNQGAWNSEDYWHRQGVFFQAWAKQDDAAIRTSGTPSAGTELRERLRQRVAAALDPPEENGLRTLFPSSTDRNTSRQAALPSQNAWSEPPSPPRRENLPSAPEQIGEVQIKVVREHSGSPAHSATPADTRRFSRVRDGGSSIIPALLFGDRYGSTRRTWNASTRRG